MSNSRIVLIVSLAGQHLAGAIAAAAEPTAWEEATTWDTI